MTAKSPDERPTDEKSSAPVGRRRSRRRTKAGTASAKMQKPFRQPKRLFGSVDLASDEALEQIHLASLKVLSEIGIKVLHDEARSIMKNAGAQVDEASQMVRLDAELIMQSIRSAPAGFTLHSRNPEHNINVGGDEMFFGLMASAPNSSCLDHGRRSGNQQDFQNLLKLGQMHNILHVIGGYPCEPTDIHASVRHLDCISDFITLTDKAYCIYSLGHQRVTDAIEMTRIAHGLTTEELKKTPVCLPLSILTHRYS